MTTWKDVLSTVGSAVGSSSDGGDCMLDFLRILPEEVTEGRKVNLSVCSTAQHSILGFQHLRLRLESQSNSTFSI